MPRQPIIIISWDLLLTPDFIPGCGFIEKHRVLDENTSVGVKPTFSNFPSALVRIS